MSKLFRLFVLVSVSVFVSAFLSFSMAQGAELPIAVYTTGDDIITSDTLALRDTLGINYIYGAVDSAHVARLKAAGLGLIKWDGGDNDLVNRLSGESYFAVSAVDSTSFPHFQDRHGTVSGNFRISDTTEMVVDDFWIQQYALSAFTTEEPGPRQFFAKMKMAINPTGMTPDSLVGIIYVKRLLSVDSTGADTTWDLRDSILIYPNDSLLAGDTVEVPSNPPYFYLGDVNDGGVYHIKYSFWNSGKTTVYLDSLICYNQTGLDVINGLYDTDIADTVRATPWGDVDYWWLRDEPKYDFFRPLGRVRTILDTLSGFHRPMCAFYMGCIHDGQSDSTLRAFEEITHQDKIVINDYPFAGGYCSAYFTDYTGNNDDVNGDTLYDDDHRGLQKNMDLYSVPLFETAREEMAKPDSILKQIWASPQWFWSKCDDLPWDPPSSGYLWRRPTRSELRLQIGMELCYGISGFNIWRYDWGPTDNACNVSCSQGSFYTLDSPHVRDSLFWQTMRDEINPYIKAIDNTYLGLKWQRAYPLHPTYHPSPSEAYIASITAVSNSSDSNPDLGWFHIGDYKESIGAGDDELWNRYVMVVNRACSQGQYDSTEAPAITATVRFNPSSLGLGNYVYVIDLAKGTSDNNWVGYQETTYTTKMSDGAIPFTTTLKAGEGRLFKITKASHRKN